METEKKTADFRFRLTPTLRSRLAYASVYYKTDASAIMTLALVEWLDAHNVPADGEASLCRGLPDRRTV